MSGESEWKNTKHVVDPRLKEWATARQCEYIDAVNTHGGFRAAARETGTSQGRISTAILSAKSRAAMQGYSPAHDMTATVPAPFIVKGTSTLYDADGAVKIQWVKTKLDDQAKEAAVLAAIEACTQEIARAAPVPAPEAVAPHLLNLFTLTDCHVGMRAWHRETGADWDLDIAERVLVGAVSHLIASAPAASTAFVNQLGDFLHFDSLSAVTPLHGNLLDADGRYPKVVEVAVRVLRRVIGLALEKHQTVFVMIAEGNHDLSSSVWLRHLFALLYENEPRVVVVSSVTPYHAHQHGDVMLAFHHGHLSKNEALPLMFAAEYPKVWGATTRRYCHTGHRHHVDEKGHAGMMVIQHPTIAGRDAYAARGGWADDRSMTAITYHEKFGQVARSTVVPEMLDQTR